MLDNESIDIEATTIALNLVTGYFAPQLIVFGDLDFTGPSELITGFSLATTLPWLAASDISFTGNSLTLDVGTGSTDGGTATITLSTTPTSVPEPATLALVGQALLAGGAARHRRAR